MSQQEAAADRRAAAAVVRHHTQLAAALAGHVGELALAAESGSRQQSAQQRDALSAWLHDELLPHAHAEEAALYPAAADQPGGELLVRGMIGEHRAIAALVTELETAASPLGAAAAARALRAVFETHLDKENDLIVPLLVAAPDVSLADLLAGMHELIGAHGNPGEHGDQRQPAATGRSGGVGSGGGGGGVGSSSGSGSGGRGKGCGGGGGQCGCGGDTGAVDAAPAAVLSIDPRLDVRSLPHGQRHARVLAALDALDPDGALVLVAPHAPLPLLAEIEARYAGQVVAQWLQDGPDVWQVRLHRVPVTV